MNKLLTLIFILLSLTCFSQKKDTLHKFFAFDALNSFKVAEREKALRQLRALQITIQKYDSATFWPMVTDFLRANHIDLGRVSESTDSLKITPRGVELLLRKPKKK